tara:strand:+ start:913 stop:1140 length:228 start_codon:yes stop_codon:yes gene_type:complete
MKLKQLQKIETFIEFLKKEEDYKVILRYIKCRLDSIDGDDRDDVPMAIFADDDEEEIEVLETSDGKTYVEINLSL